MEKLVVIKLEGSFEQGFQATLEIGAEGSRPDVEITGQLPPAADLLTYLADWQSSYHRLKLSTRVITDVAIAVDDALPKQCSDSARQLRDRLNTWLRTKSFLPIREKWLENLIKTDQVRVIVRTDNHPLQQLPWHLWDLLERYPLAEIAFSAKTYERPSITTPLLYRGKVRILAILGDSVGIHVQRDRQLLETLPHADITFLVEPHRQAVNNQLWEQAWDIIFFAGHSKTEGATGRLYINQTDSLTIDELREALRKAIACGLQLAIFNSCDGWGLARDLEALHIPQMIIMREPVPDPVAQQFLQDFLRVFASGQSLYQSVQEARRRLQGLEDKFPCASWLPVICQNPAVAPPTWHQLRDAHRRRTPSPLPAGIASVAAAIFVLLLRQMGMLQTWELKTFDQLMRLRPDEGLDSRLLVVEATEADLNRYGFPLPDATLAQALEQLASHQPRVIGLNIFRDRPVERGVARAEGQGEQEGQGKQRKQGEAFLTVSNPIQGLMQSPSLVDNTSLTFPAYLQQPSRLIALCSAREANKPNKSGIKPPPQFANNRLGFSDVVVDADGILRRHLMFMQPHHSDPCTTNHAFSTRIAFHYLAAEGIQPHLTSKEDLQLGQAIFRDLAANAGGYRQLDDRGFQVLLNYRASRQVAQQVTLTDVLTGQVNPEWVQDRIVLIGVTAPISANTFFTLYSPKEGVYQSMPGVLIQAQMISQILSATLDRRPLLWVWPEWGEAGWILGWSLFGGVIAWRWGQKLAWIPATGAAVSVLYGVCFVLLTQGGWAPLAPAALALATAGGSAIVYTQLHPNMNRAMHIQSHPQP